VHLHSHFSLSSGLGIHFGPIDPSPAVRSIHAFDDEIEDQVQDLDDMDEEMDGDDLFNDNMMQ
jgi:hypothetical protein